MFIAKYFFIQNFELPKQGCGICMCVSEVLQRKELYQELYFASSTDGDHRSTSEMLSLAPLAPSVPMVGLIIGTSIHHCLARS